MLEGDGYLVVTQQHPRRGGPGKSSIEFVNEQFAIRGALALNIDRPSPASFGECRGAFHPQSQSVRIVAAGYSLGNALGHMMFGGKFVDDLAITGNQCLKGVFGAFK